MKETHQLETIIIPNGVKVECKNRQVRVTGPKGTIQKSFSHLPIEINKKAGKVEVSYWRGNRRECALVRTVYSKINNMIKGVVKGYRYKMRFAYAHFPILVTVSEDAKTIEVRNFLGEKRPRVVHLVEGVKATRSTNVKDEIVLDGIDNEMVGLSAAQVHQTCMVKNKDIRKFLDGIYVSDKGTQSE